MPMIATTRQCYAGWHVSAEGLAYDFQGLCQPGELPAQQSSRVCDAPFYRHSTSSNVFYDTRGYCDPSKSAFQPSGGTVQVGTSWIWYLALGVGGYMIWKYRKRIF